MNLQEAIQDVCLRKPIAAPFFVPVHQEALTKQHLAKTRTSALLRLSPEAREILIKSNPVSQEALRDVVSALRNLSNSLKCTFVTAKAPVLEPLTEEKMKQILDNTHVIGFDLSGNASDVTTVFDMQVPRDQAIFTDSDKFLTVQRGKRRRGQSESFQFHAVFDENSTVHIDEVKELPPPKPEDQ
jgi:hypothetical protein